MLRNKAQATVTAAVVAMAACGCGEVFSDLTIETQATSLLLFEPAQAVPDATHYLKVLVDLPDPNNYLVDHNAGLDDGDATGILLENWSKGDCEADGVEVDDSGLYIYCGVLTVFDDAQAGDRQIVVEFWSGSESVIATGTFKVVPLISE